MDQHKEKPDDAKDNVNTLSNSMESVAVSASPSDSNTAFLCSQLAQKLGITPDWKSATTPNSPKELDDQLNDRNTIMLRQETPSSSTLYNPDGVVISHSSLNENVFDNSNDNSTTILVDSRDICSRKRPLPDSS